MTRSSAAAANANRRRRGGRIAAVIDCCDKNLGKIDFLLHSIAFALPDDLKGDTIATSRAGFKLAMEISRRCDAIDKDIDVLIEVNVSGEEAKYGVAPEQVEELRSTKL